MAALAVLGLGAYAVFLLIKNLGPPQERKSGSPAPPVTPQLAPEAAGCDREPLKHTLMAQVPKKKIIWSKMTYIWAHFGPH